VEQAERTRKLAELAVRTGANVQPGQIVVIATEPGKEAPQVGGAAARGFGDVALASTRLDVPGDPADEMIAATSVVHRLPLVTRDRNLRRSQQVPLAPAA